jgi:hypothetical protein
MSNLVPNIANANLLFTLKGSNDPALKHFNARTAGNLVVKANSKEGAKQQFKQHFNEGFAQIGEGMNNGLDATATVKHRELLKPSAKSRSHANKLKFSTERD